MPKLIFDLSTKEVNGTQVVTLALEDYEIGRYVPHTRYDDLALHTMERALASALGDLLRPKLEEFGISEHDGEGDLFD